MRRSTFLKMSALATFSCLCMMDVSAARQVIRSERFGDGYAFGVNQCVSTTESLTDKDGRALFSSTVSHTETGDQFTDRTQFTYADDGLSSIAVTETLKQKNLGSDNEGEVLEFVFDNKSRSFTFFNQEGKTIRTYGQNWQARSTGSDWSSTNTAGWEYDYDAAGRVATARYWMMYSESKDPNYTFTLSYDADGNLVQMLRDGAYATSPLKVDLTWKEGRLVRMDYKKSKEKDADGNPVWIDDCNYIFTYDGDLLTDYAKYSYLADGSTEGTTKNCFEYGGNGTFVRYATSLGMSGVNYGVADTDYETVTTYSVSKKSIDADGDVIWASPSQKYVSYWADLDSAESLVADGLTAAAGSGMGEVLVSCNVPGNHKEITATLYRDCEAVISKTLSDFGEAFDDATRTLTISDRTTAGLHKYTVALSQPGAAGVAYGHVPAPVEFEVEANLPQIANFRVLDARRQEKTVTGQDEDGKFVTQTIVNNIVTVAWDPISRDDAETYGFNKYEFWNDLYSIGVGYSDSRFLSRYDINIENREESDVWMEVDYGMGRVKSEKIHVRMADYEKHEEATVWGIAKIYNPDFYDSDFSLVKGDLNDTENEPELLADLYVTDDMEVSNVYGGTTVGEYYYAHMSDDWGRNQLYSINFSSNEVVPVASFEYGDPAYDATNLVYDAATDRIYATADVYDPEADEIMHRLLSIDYTNGHAETIADLAAAPYLMAAGDGVIYAGVQEGTYGAYKMAIYTLDPTAGTLTRVDDIDPFEINMNEAKAMAFHDGKLHITIGTAYTLVDLANGTVANMPALKKGYFAFTFKQSTLTAEAAENPDDKDSRKIYRQASYGDSMGAYSDDETREILYYYNLDGNIAREINRSRKADNSGVTDEWFTDGLTQYEYDAEGRLAQVNAYQYGQYDLDMDSRQLRSMKEYAYDEAGQLVKETETFPSTIIGMDDTVNETEYTYDAAGNVATKTVSSRGYVDSKEEFTYDDQNRIIAVSAEAYGQTTASRYAYDDLGRLASIIKTTEDGQTLNMQAWEYFGETMIVSSQAEYYSFDADGTPNGGFRTVFEATEGDMNLILSHEESLFDGEWTSLTGSTKASYYADFAGMAEEVATTLTVEPADGINAARLTFTIPNVMMIGMVDSGIRIFRNGENVATFTSADFDKILDFDSMMFVWNDALVPNGDNEYFVQPVIATGGGMEPFDIEITAPEYIGYNISNIADITFDTELPAVSGFSILGYEKAYVNEYDQPVSNPLYGREVNKVTLKWTNPADAADYGFISNNVYMNPYLLKMASVDDPAADTAQFYVELDSKPDIYVRSVYKLGYADSQIYTVDLDNVGVGSAAASGARIADGILTLDSPADIEVFDVQGRRMASASAAETLDLRSLDGIVVIVITRADKAESIKTTLR